MEKISVGKRIKNLREGMGLTQEKLASLLNLSSQSVSKWENEEGWPAVDTLIQLSNTFRVSLDELITGKAFENSAFEFHMRDIYNHANKGFSVDKEIERFASLLVPEANSKDHYWETSASNVLQGVLHAMLEDKNIDLSSYNLETIEKVIFQAGKERENNDKIKEYFEGKSLKCQQLASPLLKAPFNTANSIIGVIINAINK